MRFEKQLPSTRTTEIDSISQKASVLPVIAVERIEDAVPLGKALYEG
ncbi:keto-deoxy-phosphogluconate aldolase, partial [Cobetia marina]